MTLLPKALLQARIIFVQREKHVDFTPKRAESGLMG